MKRVALCVSHGLKIMNKFKLLKLDKFDVDVFQLQPYSKESILTEFKNHYTINWGKSLSFTDDIILKFLTKSFLSIMVNCFYYKFGRKYIS